MAYQFRPINARRGRGGDGADEENEVLEQGTVIIDRVRVARVCSPKEYFQRQRNADEMLDRTYTIFQEAAAPNTFFKGRMRMVDPLHAYRLKCRKAERMRFSSHPTREVVAVLAEERLPLDCGLLREVAEKFGGGDITSDQLSADIEKLSLPARTGRCGHLLREVGERSWFQTLEKMFPVYFTQWYIEELCKDDAYTEAAIRTLPLVELAKMARMAAMMPWKLCFWWLHELTIVDELTLAKCERLARAFGSESALASHHIAGARAYSGDPFGRARDRGDTHVPASALKASIPDDMTRAALKKNGLVDIVPIAPGDDDTGATETTFGARFTGDALCEQVTAKAIVLFTTTNSDQDVSVFPESLSWPWNDAACGIVPNEEQLVAIRAARERRLLVVGGLPGTGKTSVVEKSIVSMFPRGTAVGVAFTGMAAQRLHSTTGTGITAHRIIDAWRRVGYDVTAPSYRYGKYRVLVLEEASTMSIRLLRLLLCALGSSLRRIYIFGDYRQMPPPGGGSSLLAALLKRYRGTPLCVELTQSMRLTDPSGVFARNLDRICNYNEGKAVPLQSIAARPQLALEWTHAPSDDGCPFVFLNRGRTEVETVAIIRRALEQCGLPPDDPTSDYHIVVHTNEQCRRLGQALYAAGPFARVNPQFREHEFHLGERVMFLENNYGCTPRGSEWDSDPVMNGTVGVIAAIFDENAALASPQREIKEVEDTAAPRSFPSQIRWIQLAEPLKLMVAIDSYKRENIVRAQPATVSKMQGQETGVVVVYIEHIDQSYSTYSRRELYTACSRGKRMCVVVGGGAGAPPPTPSPAPAPASESLYSHLQLRAVPVTKLVERDDNRVGGGGDEGGLRPCPDPDFEKIIVGHSILAERTTFWKEFPEFAKIDPLTQTSPRITTSRGEKRSAPDH